MAIAFNAVLFRHERRARLVFTNSLDSAAFTSTAYYSVTNLDGLASSPAVQKAMGVANSPEVVELQFGADLVPGALYRFEADGVPAVDASTTATPSTVDARMPRDTRDVAAGTRGASTTIEEILYGRDLRWSGGDFAEAPDGDLAVTVGAECVDIDLNRRMLEENGLPWDPSFGLKARGWIDGSSAALPGLRGRAIAQLLADDRVAKADAKIDLSNPEEPILEVTPTLIGSTLARPPAPQQIKLGS